MARQTLTEKLESARLLIFNSKDPQVAPLLEAIGINSTYLDRGEALYMEVTKLVDDQKAEYQEQSQAYDTFYLEKDDAKVDFNRTMKLVRVLAGNDNDLQDRLGLPLRRTNAIEPWIESAIDFYNRLLNEVDFITKIEGFKITVERINTEKTSIEKLRQLRNEVMIEKGQAQEATRLRNEKLDELDDYTTELKAIAKLALEEQPQLLEKLGIVTR